MAMQEQIRVQQWMKAFGQDCPTQPIIPPLEIRKLRAKLILEEALETINALGFRLICERKLTTLGLTREDYNSMFQLVSWQMDLDLNRLSIIEPNLIDIIDGCEDLKVVIEGTLVACGCLTKSTRYCTSREDCGYGDCPTAFCDLGKDVGTDEHFNEVMRANEGKLWTPKEIYDRFGAFTPFQINKPKTTAEGFILTFLHIEAAFKEKCYLVKDPSGKIVKPPSFVPPDHQKILDERNK